MHLNSTHEKLNKPYWFYKKVTCQCLTNTIARFVLIKCYIYRITGVVVVYNDKLIQYLTTISNIQTNNIHEKFDKVPLGGIKET